MSASVLRYQGPWLAAQRSQPCLPVAHFSRTSLRFSPPHPLRTVLSDIFRLDWCGDRDGVGGACATAVELVQEDLTLP